MFFIIVNPVYTWTCITVGVLELFMGIVTACKVVKGSRSQFALGLLAFTILDGLTNISFFFVTTMMYELEFDIGDHPIIQIGTFESYYLRQVTNYFFFMTSLQPWLFSLRYLQSSIKSSIGSNRRCCTLKHVKWTAIIGTLLYTVTITVITIIMLSTFPGYINGGTFDDYNKWTHSLFDPLFNTVNVIWTLFNWISVVLTSVAVYWLLQQIKLFDSNLNKKTFVLHVVILTLNCVAVSMNSVPYWLVLDWTYMLQTGLTVIDLLV